MTVVFVSSSRSRATFRPYASIDSTDAKLLRCPKLRKPETNESPDNTPSNSRITAGIAHAILGPLKAQRSQSTRSSRHALFSVIRCCTLLQKGGNAMRDASESKTLFRATCNFSNCRCSSLQATHSSRCARTASDSARSNSPSNQAPRDSLVLSQFFIKTRPTYFVISFAHSEADS